MCLLQDLVNDMCHEVLDCRFTISLQDQDVLEDLKEQTWQQCPESWKWVTMQAVSDLSCSLAIQSASLCV